MLAYGVSFFFSLFSISSVIFATYVGQSHLNFLVSFSLPPFSTFDSSSFSFAKHFGNWKISFPFQEEEIVRIPCPKAVITRSRQNYNVSIGCPSYGWISMANQPLPLHHSPLGESPSVSYRFSVIFYDFEIAWLSAVLYKTTHRVHRDIPFLMKSFRLHATHLIYKGTSTSKMGQFFNRFSSVFCFSFSSTNYRCTMRIWSNTNDTFCDHFRWERLKKIENSGNY